MTKYVLFAAQSNPGIQDWMKANSFDSLSQLESYFESRVLDLATLAGRSYIVWQVHPKSLAKLDAKATGRRSQHERESLELYANACLAWLIQLSPYCQIGPARHVFLRIAFANVSDEVTTHTAMQSIPHVIVAVLHEATLHTAMHKHAACSKCCRN